MRSFVFVVPAFVLVASAAAIAACGSSSDDTSSGTPSGADAAIDGSAAQSDAALTNTQMDSSSSATVDAGDDSTSDSGGGDDDATTTVTTDSGPGEETDGQAIYADAGAGACTGLVNTASDIVQQKVAQAFPTATGGNLVAGLYYKVSDTIYLGPGGTAAQGDTIKETFNITSVNATTGAAEMDSVILTNDSAVTNEHISFQPTSGANCNFVFDCPSSYGTMALQYSVRNSGGVVEMDVFTTFEGNRVETFALQH